MSVHGAEVDETYALAMVTDTAAVPTIVSHNACIEFHLRDGSILKLWDASEDHGREWTLLREGER